MLRFPLQSASVLLRRENCHSLLETLRLIMPDSLYQQHYYTAIERFTQYVQILPARREEAFSEIQGLLEYSLGHPVYILTIGLSHLYPHQKNFHQLRLLFIEIFIY